MKIPKILNSEELLANNIKRLESIVKLLEAEGIDIPEKLHNDIDKIKNEVADNKHKSGLTNNGNNKSSQL